jgi:hypothetical protein
MSFKQYVLDLLCPKPSDVAEYRKEFDSLDTLIRRMEKYDSSTNAMYADSENSRRRDAHREALRDASENLRQIAEHLAAAANWDHPSLNEVLLGLANWKAKIVVPRRPESVQPEAWHQTEMERLQQRRNWLDSQLASAAKTQLGNAQLVRTLTESLEGL